MSVEISGVPGRVAQNPADNSQAASTDNRVSQQYQTPAGGTSSATSGDTVRLTDSATRMQQLTATVAAMPVADPQKVSDVQRAIGSGSFQIEPASAADNLMNQEREMALLEITK